jgi:hypothetical protein
MPEVHGKDAPGLRQGRRPDALPGLPLHLHSRGVQKILCEMMNMKKRKKIKSTTNAWHQRYNKGEIRRKPLFRGEWKGLN